MREIRSYGSVGAGEGNLPLYPDPWCEEFDRANLSNECGNSPGTSAGPTGSRAG